MFHALRTSLLLPSDVEALWPIVIDCRKASLLQCRRQLYESVLQHERHGACVLERELHGPDMCLSASTCLTLWTQKDLQVSP